MNLCKERKLYMRKFFLKSYRWAIIFSILLIGSFIFVMLDTFVIKKSYKEVITYAATKTTHKTNKSKSKAIIKENSYKDKHIKINIETIREYDSDIYIADIQLTNAAYLKTALAGNTYGRNIKETTSEMANQNKAIFAINGDFYGFRDYGYVIRNGVLYRDTAGNGIALVIDKTGAFSSIQENKVSLKSLDIASIWQILSFGPSLIEKGQIVVDGKSEVERSMKSNPRTAIGEISPLHYLVIVSDGRTSKSAGLSLLDLSELFKKKGCTEAYNLDGGGSSTMYFNGKVINNPTDGRFNGERKVSDIVYIGN